MKQLGFFVDISKCISCRSCMYACNSEHPKEQNHRRKMISIQKKTQDALYFSTSCNHCETPACMTVCPNHCIRKLRNGIVILNNQNCTACQKCPAACPFDSIHIHPKTNKADKCDMCYTRLKQNQQPICVESCIAEAISIHDIHDVQWSDYQAQLEEYTMKQITNPSTRYRVIRSPKQRYFQERGDNDDKPFI